MPVCLCRFLQILPQPIFGGVSQPKPSDCEQVLYYDRELWGWLNLCFLSPQLSTRSLIEVSATIKVSAFWRLGSPLISFDDFLEATSFGLEIQALPWPSKTSLLSGLLRDRMLQQRIIHDSDSQFSESCFQKLEHILYYLVFHYPFLSFNPFPRLPWFGSRWVPMSWRECLMALKDGGKHSRLEGTLWINISMSWVQELNGQIWSVKICGHGNLPCPGLRLLIFMLIVRFQLPIRLYELLRQCLQEGLNIFLCNRKGRLQCLNCATPSETCFPPRSAHDKFLAGIWAAGVVLAAGCPMFSMWWDCKAHSIVRSVCPIVGGREPLVSHANQLDFGTVGFWHPNIWKHT